MLFDEIQALLKRDLAQNKNTGLSLDFYSAYQANAIIGIILEWYRHDFTESVSTLNEQLVTILKFKP